MNPQKTTKAAVWLAAIFALAAAGAFPAQPAQATGANNAEPSERFFIGARFLDSEGKVRAVGDEKGAAGEAAILFFGENCPTPKPYARALNQMAKRAREKGGYFYGVFLAGENKWKKARDFQKQNALAFPIFADPSGDLAARATLTSLPAAFSYDITGKLKYAGAANEAFHKSLASAPAKCPLPEGAKTKAQKPPTYHRDIAPLVAANCLECHRGGGIAPFPMETYELARAFAPLIKQVTESRRMPPWKISPEPGTYRGERILSPRQIQMFADWSEAGAPFGEKAETPPPPDLGDVKWRLGKPDLVLTMPEAFSLPATGDDIYRYFVLPSGLTEDKTIIGIDFSPGEPSVVHHANFFADYSGRARKKDAENKEPGFSVFGTGEFMSYDSTEDDNFGLGGWTPGIEPRQTPMFGAWLPKGADIILEIHYKLSGKAARDQSSIAFYFSEKETPKYLDGLLIGTQDLNIPPGDGDYRRYFWMNVPVGFTLVDFMPHMHYIGKEAVVAVTNPDGKKRELVHIRDWDLGWQAIYTFRKPIHIPAGSRFEAWFSYDNSKTNPRNPHNPPQRIKWGWSSEEEMAEVWMGIIPDDWNRRAELVKASQQSWYRSATPKE